MPVLRIAFNPAYAAAVFATIALTRRQAPAVAITSGIALAFLTAAAGLASTS
jgi:hypothetical protein